MWTPTVLVCTRRWSVIPRSDLTSSIDLLLLVHNLDKFVDCDLGQFES